MIGDKVYTLGGYSPFVASSGLNEYDPATDTWVKKKSLPKNHFSIEADVIGGKIYVLGGNSFPRFIDNITSPSFPDIAPPVSGGGGVAVPGIDAGDVKF